MAIINVLSYNPANVAITGGTLDGLTQVGLAATSGGASDVILVRDAANVLALKNTTSPQGFRVYNTTDGTNLEYGQFAWSSNSLVVGTAKGGTGSNRSVVFTIGGTQVWNFSTAGNFLANTDNSFSIGAAGASRPANVFAGTSLDSAGSVKAGSGTAVTAGGSLLGLLISSTAGLGVYAGSGLPTISAAQGSLYIRTDGSSSTTRLYSNTNGTTGWTSVTTAT
jgi:hypothetical protein